LRERHCDLAQGFLLGHPQSAESFSELLEGEAARVVVPLLASGPR
jgi:EAL domain-containing protein (putative c-di-GMP-specific phosphodiesterase class I)